MFKTKCPCCGALLTVDERLRRITSHLTQEQAAQKPEERLGSILGHLQKEDSERETQLEAAKQRESQRKKHVDELFKKAQEKAKESDEDDKPHGPTWD